MYVFMYVFVVTVIINYEINQVLILLFLLPTLTELGSIMSCKSGKVGFFSMDLL